MKCQNSCGPHWGKLVHQLPRVITFSHDLRLGNMIARWKGLDKELHFIGSSRDFYNFEVPGHQKMSFKPSKWPQNFGTQKTAKNSKLSKNCFEPVGIGGWPLISTYIITRGLYVFIISNWSRF
jgi:hypothetical protein